MTIYKKNFVFRLIVFVFFGFFLAGKNNCVLAQNPDQSLVGWWRFDGESGESQTLFKDSSAFGNNAICRDNSCPVLVNGKFGKALRFDGVDDYLEIANSFSLENITESSFTWSAWYRPDNPPPDDIAPFEGYHVRQALICKEGWHTAISYGNNSLFHAELRAADNTPYWLDSPSSYTAQAWHYLSLSADSASKVLTLYVDGQAVKSMPYSGTSREYNLIMTGWQKVLLTMCAFIIGHLSETR